MIQIVRNKALRWFVAILILCTPSLSVLATWSIVAVDRDSGEIGIAGASCTFDVSGIASVVPGKGAIVVQAASDYFARMKGVELMQKDASTEDILTAMKAEKFKPMRQQYGVILLDSEAPPSVFSGSDIKQWRGSKVSDEFAVLGNILVDESVIEAAFKVLDGGNEQPFAQRLMGGLKAGEVAGGDKRCGDQKARSAFIMIYSPITDAITKLSVYGTDPDGQAAVSLLQEKFQRLNVTSD